MGRPTCSWRPRCAPARHPEVTIAPSATRREILLSRQGSWSDRFQAHWMMKAGVAMVLAGILLLKFA